MLGEDALGFNVLSRQFAYFVCVVAFCLAHVGVAVRATVDAMATNGPSAAIQYVVVWVGYYGVATVDQVLLVLGRKKIMTYVKLSSKLWKSMDLDLKAKAKKVG